MRKLFVVILGFILLSELMILEISTPVYAVIPDTQTKSSKTPFLNKEDNNTNDATCPILINEIKAQHRSTGESGWIELYNSSVLPVNLDGYYLSNDAANLRKWKFPHVNIGPGELLLVRTSAKVTDISSKELKADFEISPNDKSIILTNPDGITIADQIALISISDSISFGRYPDGSSSLRIFSTPTKDSSNNNIILKDAPGKPGIAITWDDDSVDEWHNLLSFEWYKDIKTTFCLTQSYCFSEYKWEKLRDLQRHGHEIACHGYNHQNALYYAENNRMQAYINNEIVPAINLMKSYGLSPGSFAYPYGAHNNTTDSALLNYFKTVRVTGYSKDGDPFKWGTTNVLPANGMDSNYPYTIEDYYKWLENAKNTGQVVILYGHTPTAEPSGNYRTPHQKLELIIKRAKELNLTFYTLSELSAEVGTLKVDTAYKGIGRLEWSLDRKTWHSQGKSITLPPGEYMLMVRSAEKQGIKPVKIENGKTTIIN